MNYVFGSELSIKETILRQIYDVKILNAFLLSLKQGTGPKSFWNIIEVHSEKLTV